MPRFREGRISTQKLVRVGDWTVEPELQLLRRGDELVRLEPRTMAVLFELLARPGEVVPKEQLIDAVWHTEFITENALTRAIADLRKAFGDDARQPSYIETVHRRGYRVIAAVTELAAPSGQEVTRPRVQLKRMAALGLLAGVLTASVLGLLRARQIAEAPADGPARLVVLPFDSIGAVDESAFAAGLTEEVTSSLVETGRMLVISRTSAESVETDGRTAREVGDALDADYLLEGSVRWSQAGEAGPDVRITMQLVRTADDVHVWSESFDRGWGDLLGIQTEIASEVAERLGVALLVGADAAPRPLSGNAAAFHAFIKGRGYEANANIGDLATAVSLYERALELDPSFALAAAHLAMAHCAVYNFGVDLSDARIEAASAALKQAQALAPMARATRLASVQVKYYMERDLGAARDELEDLEREWPADVEILTTRAYVDRRLGEWEGSTERFQRALAIDPANVHVLWNLSTNLRALGDFEAADRYGRQAVTLAPDAKVGYWVQIINYLYWDGTTDRARQVLDEIPEPHEHEWWVMAVRIEMLDRRWQRALELIASRDDPAMVSQARVLPRGLMQAICLAALHRDDEAVHCAEEALTWLDGEIAARPKDFRLVVARARTLAELGRPREALLESRRAEEMLPLEKDHVLAPTVLFDAVRVAVRAGEFQCAVGGLEKLLAMPSEATPRMLRLDPSFDPIRRDPGFQRLLAESG